MDTVKDTVLVHLALLCFFRFVSFTFRLLNLLFCYEAKEAKQTSLFRFGKRMSLPFR
jgi:hypothetical protein